MSDDAAQIIPLYERHAQAFDRLRGRSLFERSWLDRFLMLLPSDASVLDIGCGMGEPIARYLIEKGCRITGVDSSASLIGLCQARFPRHEWLVADMRRLALRRSFDGLLAWNSFFHLGADDQRAMFKVFGEHAGGRTALMFTSGPAHGIAMGTFEGEPLFHASLDPDEYRSLIDGIGFRVVSHVAEDPDCNGHSIWLARRS